MQKLDILSNIIKIINIRVYSMLYKKLVKLDKNFIISFQWRKRLTLLTFTENRSKASDSNG